MKKFTLCILMLLIASSCAFSAPSEIDNLRKNLSFKIDEVECITWIKDEATVRDVNTYQFYVYLGQQDGHTWARLHADF